jgi:hypothetical protein
MAAFFIFLIILPILVGVGLWVAYAKGFFGKSEVIGEDEDEIDEIYQGDPDHIDYFIHENQKSQKSLIEKAKINTVQLGKDIGVVAKTVKEAIEDVTHIR